MDIFNELKIDGKVKILITGVAGFIGSNLLEFLLKKDFFIRGLDNFETGSQSNIDSAIKEASKLNKNIKFEFIKGDIRNKEDCINSTKNINIVLHHAALGSVQRSFDNPIDSSLTNINGTLLMLKASLENNVSRFIYASSSSIYGDSEKLPKVETMPPNPKSIYALTKLSAEYYCRLFYRLYKLNTITLRYFNVFGKRQNPDSIYSAVIPIFIKNIIKNKVLVIYGDGDQSRDFTHIDNVLRANYLAINSNNNTISGNYYNIACNKNTSLKGITDILSKSLNKDIKIIYERERIGDIKHSLASIKKAGKDLLYKPTTYIKDGLLKYLEQFDYSK